jgi:hypothetical protein
MVFLPVHGAGQCEASRYKMPCKPNRPTGPTDNNMLSFSLSIYIYIFFFCERHDRERDCQNMPEIERYDVKIYQRLREGLSKHKCQNVYVERYDVKICDR